MKVRMKTSMAGETASLRPGQIVEVDDQIGQAWIEADIAADANAVDEYRFEPSLPKPPSSEKTEDDQSEASENSGTTNESTETVPPAELQPSAHETQGKASKGKGSSRKKS